MNLRDALVRSKIAIVGHVYATGPGHELEKYLKSRVNSLIFVGHPFPHCLDRRSFYRWYKKGKLIRERKAPSFLLPGVLSYLKDIVYTLFWISFSTRYDFYFGVNNLNAFCGLILKRFRRVKKVIFYTIDYIPKRFNNRGLNKIYHFVDSYCVKRSDYVWNLSSMMIKEREKKGISQKYREKQLTVPIGANLSVKKVPPDANGKCRIAFMGHLREGQGVELLIGSLPELIKKIPEIRLILIGGGPLETGLRKRVEELNLADYVEFTGFIKDHSEVQDRLSECSIGIAPYVDDEETYTRYTDPGKPKAYLAAGLPVVITKVPQIAYEIERWKAGIAINYERKELIEAIVKILKNGNLYREYSNNASTLAKKFDWNRIFEKALTQTLGEEYD